MEIGEGGHSLIIYAGILAEVNISKVRTTAKQTRIESGDQCLRIRNKTLNGYTIGKLAAILKRRFK